MRKRRKHKKDGSKKRKKRFDVGQTPDPDAQAWGDEANVERPSLAAEVGISLLLLCGTKIFFKRSRSSALLAIQTSNGDPQP